MNPLALAQRRMAQVRIGVEAQLVLTEIALMQFALQLAAWEDMSIGLDRAIQSAHRLRFSYNDFTSAALEQRTDEMRGARLLVANMDEAFGRLTLALEAKDALVTDASLSSIDANLVEIVCMMGRGA